jgi:pimeloyl-ACP methyl ester carboxylesterase
MADALPEALRTTLGAGGRRAARLVDSLRFLTTGCTLLDDLAREEDIDDGTLASLGCSLGTVYGTRSSCLPAGRRLARLHPNARSIELEGGHFLPVEAAGLVTAAIVELVDG